MRGRRIIQKTSISNTDKVVDLLLFTDSVVRVESLGECQEWKGAINTDGYAHMLGNVKVHRLMYSLLYPEEDIKGKVVRHDCDNPKCIRPGHLRLGAFGDNGHDKFLRNRQPRVITKEIVFKVREMLKTPMKPKDIAKELGINPRRVSDIKRGLYQESGKFVRKVV